MGHRCCGGGGALGPHELCTAQERKPLARRVVIEAGAAGGGAGFPIYKHRLTSATAVL